MIIFSVFFFFGGGGVGVEWGVLGVGNFPSNNNFQTITFLNLFHGLLILSCMKQIYYTIQCFQRDAHPSQTHSKLINNLLFMWSKANEWQSFGSGGWILIPYNTQDKTPPGNHLRWNISIFHLKSNTCIRANPRSTKIWRRLEIFAL